MSVRHLLWASAISFAIGLFLLGGQLVRSQALHSDRSELLLESPRTATHRLVDSISRPLWGKHWLAVESAVSDCDALRHHRFVVAVIVPGMGGFGDRLVCIESAGLLAIATNSTLLISWEDPAFALAQFWTPHSWEWNYAVYSRCLEQQPITTLSKINTLPSGIERILDGHFHVLKYTSNIGLLPHLAAISPAVVASARPFYPRLLLHSLFRPSASIEAFLQPMLQWLGNRVLVVLQVRVFAAAIGDTFKSPWSDLKSYQEIVDVFLACADTGADLADLLPARLAYVILSDDVHTEAEFRKRLGDRCWSFANSSPPVHIDRPNANRDDLALLRTLAEAWIPAISDIVVFTAASGFSRTASGFLESSTPVLAVVPRSFEPRPVESSYHHICATVSPLQRTFKLD